MSSNIKSIFIFLFFGFNLLQAQEQQAKETEGQEDPETVFFNLEVFRPVAIGNSSFTNDYSFNAGFAFDFNWFLRQDFTIGTHFEMFEGNVENRGSVGNFYRTRIYIFGLTAGYYYELDPEWNIHATAGVGKTENRNTAPGDRFSELGTAYWVQVQVAHRFNRTVAVYFKLGPSLHSSKIEVPEHLDNYFNNNIFINAGLGFRINLQNPGG